mmetsp:Transcript_2926/g.9153  ORF Transcript_2926/g.9153 Transcript_2926/m.9153 type:complete len:400 (-) Transcript_2926:999-2198(-)
MGGLAGAEAEGAVYLGRKVLELRPADVAREQARGAAQLLEALPAAGQRGPAVGADAGAMPCPGGLQRPKVDLHGAGEQATHPELGAPVAGEAGAELLALPGDVEHRLGRDDALARPELAAAEEAGLADGRAGGQRQAPRPRRRVRARELRGAPDHESQAAVAAAKHLAGLRGAPATAGTTEEPPELRLGEAVAVEELRVEQGLALVHLLEHQLIQLLCKAHGVRAQEERKGHLVQEVDALHRLGLQHALQGLADIPRSHQQARRIKGELTAVSEVFDVLPSRSQRPMHLLRKAPWLRHHMVHPAGTMDHGLPTRLPAQPPERGLERHVPPLHGVRLPRKALLANLRRVLAARGFRGQEAVQASHVSQGGAKAEARHGQRELLQADRAVVVQVEAVEGGC